ncbi:FERM and PDZ domain-containing protein 1 [Myxocyprinus asiaticus]|uniref:FERM and PDZ domain-containing protein 1 n=1 Tax=Myxocyprinus asiaticus TaxID=70543 RepID=UPI002223D9EA|nr:FERM and PDZ domain-containing protein 1 [Myxocyprinus asiaticus]XP_051514493.1 FERM and PDZ domain-containing protein 1 [Myxocyprinus asiaticus]XP_051514494.1 FERM and PDZ domain-containing protein 1 [Myxocyprinus asiaticus]
MEERERSRSRSPRRVGRVEQVVGKWLRRSRDSLSRERILGGRRARSREAGQQNFPVKVTVEVIRDDVLDSHGFTLSAQHPLLVRDVTPGGPADGQLLPGDQILKVNNNTMEDLSPENAEQMIRECQDSVTMTILRNMSNPKSSFITAEKRARLRRNPVKVRFAEEVVVNGHTQGNSLLFLANVLKVYLENGQTKAFKFHKTTTVKDIVLTLKEKLSIRSIEHFSLVLEQQYNNTKLLLLHEEELIQKVVQKKDSHDYRCLFRVCFIPRDPVDLMQDDPAAFEYLFQQSVGDVLQERYAVEMKCNTALRLAALHMHEKLASCGQTTRASVKAVVKEFGLESFISPTLLRNMREKDLRKALNHHMKKIQSLLEPRQKVISVSQARLAYLTQMAELMSYSGRSYNATMLLQDRESLVSLLVGARYGISQILNHQLNMISTIIDFHYITRIEVLAESDRVSMVKIYLQDIQPMALLMESVAAKDLACLLAGYCKLLVDPNINVFRWRPRPKMRRILVEEGYISRCGSDSEDSSEDDYAMESLLDTQLSEDTMSNQTNDGTEEGEEAEGKTEAEAERVKVIVTHPFLEDEGSEAGKSESVRDEGFTATMDALLETGWYTDPRVNSSFSSLSSNSLNALEESIKAAIGDLGQMDDPQEGKPSSGTSSLDVHHPYLLEVPERLDQKYSLNKSVRLSDLSYDNHSGLRYTDLSQMSDSLPSLPAASDDALSDEEEDDKKGESGKDGRISSMSAEFEAVLASCSTNSINAKLAGVNFQALFARIHNYPACRQEGNTFPHNQTDANEVKQQGPSSKIRAQAGLRKTVPSNVLEKAKDTRDSGSESEEEFFDAQDRFTPPTTEQHPTENGSDLKNIQTPLSDIEISVEDHTKDHEYKDSRRKEKIVESTSLDKDTPNEKPSLANHITHSGSKNTELEVHQPSVILPPTPTPVEPKLFSANHTSVQQAQHCNGDIPGRNAHLSSQLLEMEPDTMEFKPVTGPEPSLSSSLITAVRQATLSQTLVDPETQNGPRQQNGISDHTPVCVEKKTPPNHVHPEGLDTQDIKPTQKEPTNSKGKTEPEKIKADSNGSLQSLESRKPENKPPKLQTKPPIPPKPATIIFQPSSITVDAPVQKPEAKKNVPPNGLSLHPWSQRNGTTPPTTLSKGVSLSHENLRTELKAESSTVKVSSASNTPTPSPLPSPSVQSISTLPEDLAQTGTSFLNRKGSSGRLSATVLRGKIQDMPWYLTRSQEILGTVALSNTMSSTGNKATNGTDGNHESKKVSPKATSVPSLIDRKEKYAEVVIVKLKDGPEEATQIPVKDTNGKPPASSSHPDLRQKFSTEATDLHRHFGTCKSEQPQSQKGNLTEIRLENTSSLSSTSPSHRDACGCHTVYATCFSADTEDNCGFDDNLTVYEFSRRNQISKPPQPTLVPSHSIISAPSSNVLSLLRDSPRPLSTSSELSPLLIPPRPLKSLPLDYGPIDNPLRTLQGRHYVTGQKGAGLKDGYASLQQDIDELLLLLKKGPSNIYPSCHKGQCENGNGLNGHSLSETERCLVQAEARRLASGCQRATRVGWAPDDALLSLGNSFGALVQLASTCMRVPCSDCGGCHGDIDADEALGKLEEIVDLYKEFVAAVEMAREGEGVRLLAKQCTVLISTVFSLTQLFRTRTPDIDNGNVPLNF